MSELTVADGELDGVKSLVEAKKMAYAQKIEEIYHQMQDEKQSANAEDVSATAQTEAEHTQMQLRGLKQELKEVKDMLLEVLKK